MNSKLYNYISVKLGNYASMEHFYRYSCKHSSMFMAIIH